MEHITNSMKRWNCVTALHFVSPKLLAATNYKFRPTNFEELWRKNRITQILAGRLMHAPWPKSLPAELWQTIAGFLHQECAVVTGQEQELEDSCSDSVVDLSRDVYASYITIDGIRYIRNLRNSTASEAEQGESLLLDTQIMRNIQFAYILEDHFGIRLVRFVSSNNDRHGSDLSIPGLWWRQTSTLSSISKIKTKTDGLKLRDIYNVKEEGISTHTSISCPVAAPPTATIFDLTTLQRPPELPDGLRMCYLDCNGPHTTGYSAATNGVSIATIQAHGKNMDYGLYRDVDRFFAGTMLWIYMPIDHGEHLTEIHRKFGLRHVRHDSLGLTFTSNWGRTTMFGHYFPSSEHIQFDPIYTPPNNPSRLYFNKWDSISRGYEIKFIGFDPTKPTTSHTHPNFLTPISPNPMRQYNIPWHASSLQQQSPVLCGAVSARLDHQAI
ncbi:hypothetical protein B7463_g11814, partial [Scytalidium lignicola]